VAAADADRRAAIVATLLNQPGIPVADQVAGLLVVVYGQHLSRLVAPLAVDDRDPVGLGRRPQPAGEPAAIRIRWALSSCASDPSCSRRHQVRNPPAE